MSQTEQPLDLETSRILMDIAHELFAERDVSALCEKVLTHAQQLTKADGGTLYITNPSKPKVLEFAIVNNTSLNIHQGGVTGGRVQFAPLALYDSFSCEPNMTTVATRAAHSRELINISDVYGEEDNHRGTTQIDQQSKYHTESVLALPLINQGNQLVGVLQLINAQDSEGHVIPFDSKSEQILTELGRFASVALDQQLQISSQRELLAELSSFSSPQTLLPKILKEAQSLTMADAGTIYLMEDEETEPKLRFSVIRNKTLKIDKNLLGSDEQSSFPPILLKNEQGEDNLINVASYCANTKQMVNIEDAYESTEFCFDGTKAFDQSTGYRSQSFLTLPLLNHNSDVIGVLQLINAKHPKTKETIPFAKHLEPLIKGLATYAAIALNNQILLQDHKNLLDAFVQCIAQAIDAKSPHTSAHCQRVPLLMELIAQAACEDDTVFKDFNLNEDEWYELRVSAWMHDCGKLATPDTILEKSTKLHIMQDGIDLILARLATLDSTQQAPAGNGANQFNHDEIKNIAEFLTCANKGGEFMREEDQARVRELANIQWYDLDGNAHPLLSAYEVDSLCIPKGTLSVDERKVINNHMQVTIDMLESLPFPKKLKRVPEYAGGHHEKMDGSGFPKGLTREEMSIPARMMAIADVFEALTARDRPYKPPMPLSQALRILKNMKDSQHIDPDLFDLFVRAEVWKKYADQVLLPEQKDIEHGNEYLE
ncbi:GAF and HD-GYP domain-containing protein [Litoribrevibacter albus]|uniref:HD-GYP domain-containing protein n=1 Tax=Litoribrevibacter albus TaxID=1473156 RepID=A0AA37SAG3_9GAMM|nr:HD family phosphohydrolase [Litoribrevibacter albus]GLQ32100.1 hypothetical protein GCM10007876_25790 [Litoribrevibacter albus]